MVERLVTLSKGLIRVLDTCGVRLYKEVKTAIRKAVAFDVQHQVLLTLDTAVVFAVQQKSDVRVQTCGYGPIHRGPAEIAPAWAHTLLRGTDQPQPGKEAVAQV